MIMIISMAPYITVGQSMPHHLRRLQATRKCFAWAHKHEYIVMIIIITIVMIILILVLELVLLIVTKQQLLILLKQQLLARKCFAWGPANVYHELLIE